MFKRLCHGSLSSRWYPDSKALGLSLDKVLRSYAFWCLEMFEISNIQSSVPSGLHCSCKNNRPPLTEVVCGKTLPLFTALPPSKWQMWSDTDGGWVECREYCMSCWHTQPRSSSFESFLTAFPGRPSSTHSVLCLWGRCLLVPSWKVVGAAGTCRGLGSTQNLCQTFCVWGRRGVVCLVPFVFK